MSTAAVDSLTPSDGAGRLPPHPVIDVGVLGGINEDTIEHADGRVEQALGGVLFTACALAHLGAVALGPGRLRVHLLSRTDPAIAARLRPALASVPGLRLDGLQIVDGASVRCHITYDRTGGKSEVLRGDLRPFDIHSLAPRLRELNALVVNFITGYEVTREDLSTLRQQVNGPLLMDVHSLTLGRRDDGSRFARPLPAAAEWLAAADVVQMNESEARLLGAGADLAAWATSCLDAAEGRPQTVVITRAEAGVLAAGRDEAGALWVAEVPAEDLPEGAVDPTGCGDVFLAGLTAGLLSGASTDDALHLANRAAARNCHLTGIDELHQLTRS